MSTSHHHALHVYRSDAHLTRCAARFAAKGVARGEPAILIHGAAQREPLLSQLGVEGLDVQGALAAGRIVLANAETFDEKLLGGDTQEAWNGVADLLATVRGPNEGRITVWRDSPGQLLKAGRRKEFLDLEGRWCEVTRDERITLLCSYRADLIDDAIYGGELQDIFGHHTHLLDAEDADGLEAPLHEALCDVLGQRMAGMAWALADASDPIIREMPTPIARLLWLKENMPSTWSRVISLTRRRRG